MIFLNAEKFMEEAIESVLAQGYSNWELCLVDDGSCDSSTSLARHYARLYPEKVCYLEHDEHQNRGTGPSRNLGIQAASGEYVTFLDADDVWLPHKLEQQVALLEAHPEAAMLFGRTQIWYGWTGAPQDKQRDYMLEPNLPPNMLVKPPDLLIHTLRHEGTGPATCSIIIRRQVIAALGGFEEQFRGLYEDAGFYIKLYLKYPVFVAAECWDKYRQHPDSNCAIAARSGQFHPSRPNPARLIFLRWVEKYLTEQKITAPEIWKALEEQLWPYRYPTLYRAKLGLKSLTRHILPAAIRRWIKNATARAAGNLNKLHG
jgi:glycosyltransferase involved in cell wall biosynthesis